MKPLDLAQLRSVVSGKPLTTPPDAGVAEVFVRSVCTDSRRLDPGCLFVAIKGENHDGHAFVPELKGPSEGGSVVAALVEREPATMPKGVYVLLVSSTKAAMGKLATFIRHQMSGNVIAVGGSNGKTTTKHLIDSALRGKLRGSISPKSFNNDIGVPLTIFNHDPLMDYLVLEMGTNHHGELKILSDMAEPDVAVITSISHEHLEGLSDLNGVRREESAIVSGLSPKGLLVVNGDDPDLMPYLVPYKGRRITFGFGTHNDLFATDIRLTGEGTYFKLNSSVRREVFVPLLGRHTASNALAAIAVGRRLGLSEDDIILSLAAASGPEMRQQLQNLGGVTILNDAYNANPASMKAAFETFLSLPCTGSAHRIAVVGEMRELGDASDELHRDMGKHIAGLDLDGVVFVGRQAQLARDSALSAGLDSSICTWFSDSTAASAHVKSLVREGDLVLLKGSRGVRLEVVATALGQQPDGGQQRKIAG